MTTLLGSLHTLEHIYRLIHSRTGAIIDAATFPDPAAGIGRALARLDRHTPGMVSAAAAGTWSYRALTAKGIPIGEIRPGT